MAVETHQFGPNKQITAHFLTQVGSVAKTTKAASSDQDEQAVAVGRIYADFVHKATFSLHIAIYDFRLTGDAGKEFVEALNERAKAGVDVRVAYHHAKKDRTPEVFAYLGADPAPTGSASFVGSLDKAVLSKGIEDTAELEEPVQDEPIDPASHLMHSKYIIRDGTLPSAAVLMGSTNFTNDAWSLQDNNILIFERAPELARYYSNDFGEMWDSGKIANSGRDDTGTVNIDGIPVSVSFSPGQGRQIDTDIASAIGTAQDRLLVASMVISSGAVLGAMVDRAHRVAEFGGIFDATEMEMVMHDWARSSGHAQPKNANPHTSESHHTSHGHARGARHSGAHARTRAGAGAYHDAHHGNTLAEARGGASQGKAQLFAAIAPLLHSKSSLSYSADTPHNFMHNKVAVCDNTVVTGSFNFSTNATRNAENVVMVKNQEVADAYAAFVHELMKLYPHMGLPNGQQGNQ
jgi:phosphatidylserine/phosphatidylglycerophosphate/cardiolipin synthase-like enzyme